MFPTHFSWRRLLMFPMNTQLYKVALGLLFWTNVGELLSWFLRWKLNFMLVNVGRGFTVLRWSKATNDLVPVYHGLYNLVLFFCTVAFTYFVTKVSKIITYKWLHSSTTENECSLVKTVLWSRDFHRLAQIKIVAKTCNSGVRNWCWSGFVLRVCITPFGRFITTITAHLPLN